MKRSRHIAIRTVATSGLLGTAVSIGAASLPIPDPACGGNGDGIAVTGVAADNGYATHAVVQADGGFVIVDSTGTTAGQQTVRQVVLARFDAHGLANSGFGLQHDGFYRSAFDDLANDIAQTGDGSLVYTGQDSNADVMIIGGLHADGTPDTDFFLSGRRLITPSTLFDGGFPGVLYTVLPLPKATTFTWSAAASMPVTNRASTRHAP